jgi:D-3-phosphoglycerate dehydrogenase
MMDREKVVLVTDYAWPNLEPEREIFSQARARILLAETGATDELVALAPQADAILCNWKPVPASVLKAASHCVAIGRYGIGLDNIDVRTATELGMIVTNVPAYCIDDVADHAMALLLACNRKVCWFDRDIKAGRYELQAHTPLHRLRGHTLGLAGFGRIGRAVAQRALAFGLLVIALKPRVLQARATDGVKFVDFSELLEQSDYLSLHLPATPETVNLFRRESLQRMKQGAVLINTSRGSLLDQEDLLWALETGKIAAAGIDVWRQEPVPHDDWLALHPRVIATPHAAFYSHESLLELQTTAALQIVAILEGRMPENVVNAQVLKNENLRAYLSP